MIILRLIFAGFLFVLAVCLSALFVAIGTPLAVDMLVAVRDVRSPNIVIVTPTPTLPATPTLFPTPVPFSSDLPATPGDCDPAYPSICIKMQDDVLSCDDIPYRRFVVLPPDPQRFDQDGDGVGCES